MILFLCIYLIIGLIIGLWLTPAGTFEEEGEYLDKYTIFTLNCLVRAGIMLIWPVIFIAAKHYKNIDK